MASQVDNAQYEQALKKKLNLIQLSIYVNAIDSHLRNNSMHEWNCKHVFVFRYKDDPYETRSLID